MNVVGNVTSGELDRYRHEGGGKKHTDRSRPAHAGLIKDRNNVKRICGEHEPGGEQSKREDPERVRAARLRQSECRAGVGFRMGLSALTSQGAVGKESVSLGCVAIK